jgi:probable HAF family extracellular repeat protein
MQKVPVISLAHLVSWIAPGNTGSEAWAVSADGSVVVGGSYGGANYQAFRWTAATGMVGIDQSSSPSGRFTNSLGRNPQALMSLCEMLA